MATLCFALAKATPYGHKSDLTVITDGSGPQNWCSQIFSEFPEVVDAYAGENQMSQVRWLKTVSGHGKGKLIQSPELLRYYSNMLGEIDSAHGAPKRDVRKRVQHQAATHIRHAADPLGGLDTGDKIVRYLETLPRYSQELQIKPDPRGFQLKRRFVKLYIDDNETMGNLFLT